MTDKNEVLELAKKCGARATLICENQKDCPDDDGCCHHQIRTFDPCIISKSALDELAATLEEKHQARIAMLDDEMERAAIACAQGNSNIARDILESAIAATSADADAFVARVRAEEQEKISQSCREWIAAANQLRDKKDMESRQFAYETVARECIGIAAELRNSAEQPEGITSTTLQTPAWGVQPEGKEPK